MSQVTIGDKLQIRCGSAWAWSRVTRIDSKTYIMPVYVCKVLHGDHAGETIATTRYLDRARPGQHIDHALPATVNA